MQQQIFISIPLNEFQSLIRESVKVELQSQNKTLPEKEDSYLSRAETASLLKVSIPTLFKLYTKQSLVGMRIGNKLLFSRKNIEKFLAQNKTIKNAGGIK